MKNQAAEIARTVQSVTGMKYTPIYFNDLSKDKTKRSVKLIGVELNSQQKDQVLAELKNMKMEVTKEYEVKSYSGGWRVIVKNN